ncbi:Eisosome component PIL1-domain-containing protein [Lyophyllum atratum]|nr:Eisosome component PIL1-domain-containing protein [Lyophyllum atratum]
MPVPSFLASFADKAQSAINASPLASHLPGARPTSPDSAAQPTANDAAAHGTQKSHTLGALQHQLRAFGQQYASTTPVQKIITVEKGIAIDYDSVSRDAKSQSKELYTWGQTEPEDLKDVTDRLAYLNFVQGSLASSLSLKLDAARTPLKALRDAETAIAPRRNLRASLHNQLARIEHDQQKGMEKKISELKDQIKKAELDDQAQENEIELLKRKAVRESEQLKWEAFREYGEKLVLLSQASAPIIGALPTLPPTPNQPYTGAQATGAARASLQRALDNYKTGHINLPPQLTGADLHRSDTRSFGESHASELSSINSDVTHASGATHGISTTPPYSQPPTPSKPAEVRTAGAEKTASPPPINPAALNQSPAPIPTSPPSGFNSPAVPLPTTSPSPVVIPPAMPTVAETGVPVSAGTDGPGPASGSLHDIRAASENAGPRSGGQPAQNANAATSTYGQLPSPERGSVVAEQKYTSAEEEKRRLQATYSQVPPPTTTAPPPSTQSQFEGAEDEKKRLEREERERLLGAGSGTDNTAKKDGNDELPPYQDM